MAQAPNYTAYHPRWLRRRVSTYWWLGSWSYFAFVLREASCLFVAWFVVYLLLLVRAVLQGDASYQQFLAWSARPAILLLNITSFLFLVYHAFTARARLADCRRALPGVGPCVGRRVMDPAGA